MTNAMAESPSPAYIPARYARKAGRWKRGSRVTATQAAAKTEAYDRVNML